MRSRPIFTDLSGSLSFFLTTAAKKPRTECGCHPVASMIAKTVAPLAWRNSLSTVSCFEVGSPFGCPAAAFTAALEFALLLLAADRLQRLVVFLFERFAGRLDFFLPVTIGPLLMC